MTLGLMMVGHSAAAAVVENAAHAEALGFTHVWLADERFYREVYSLLTAIALRTRKVVVGPCVTDPYSRHPALTAQAIYTLDEMSGQRAVFGIGAGVSGLAEIGAMQNKPVLAMREAIELVRLLASGEPVTYEGDVIKFHGGKLGFKPVRRDVPVWVAANGPLGQKMAARTADAVIMEGCGAAQEMRSLRTRTAAAAPERPVQCIARLNLSISDDPEAARVALRLRATRLLTSGRTRLFTLGEQRIEVPKDALTAGGQIPYNAGFAPYEAIAPVITDAMVDAVALGGTPEELRVRVSALFAAGMDGLIVAPVPAAGHDYASTLERFVAEVWTPVRTAHLGPSV